MSASIPHNRRAYDPNTDAFVTDSYPIGIDTFCSRCITPSIDDFVDTPSPVSGLRVSGIGPVHATATFTGTVRWCIYDALGVRRTLLIPNTICVPSAPYRLLSPQHLDQELMPHETTTTPDGTYSVIFSDRLYLAWDDRQFSVTAPLNRLNVVVPVHCYCCYCDPLSSYEYHTISNLPHEVMITMVLHCLLFRFRLLADNDIDDGR